jgi:hypothetical protein
MELAYGGTQQYSKVVGSAKQITPINMKSRLFFMTIGMMISGFTIAQNRLDSLINTRKTDFIDGKLPTYYTPGHRVIASKYQSLITDAIQYYETKYSKDFNVKLAVIDSADWLKEVYPYGFVFYVEGWIGMNTGMKYKTFEQVYGLKSISDRLGKELKKKNITKDDLIDAVYKFFCVHELGHYYIRQLSNTKAPDRLTNEFIASYFCYEYFSHTQPGILDIFEIFSKTDRDLYTPEYVSIKDFNQIYAAMGIENYLWYHSNYYFLIKSLYKNQGDDYLEVFESIFPKSTEKELSQEELTDLWDKSTNGLVKPWIAKLESKK